MDSRTQLDYALFQLTPTRTRCDLVIFAGKKSEKIASGLLEPFLSHLRSAKDQILKGGYSITLRPAAADASSWFTKATLEKFVRFVSTPEVLERLVTIEREIEHIQNSIESNEHVNGTADLQGTDSATDRDPKILAVQSKTKVESSGGGDAETEERPKIRLQRVLESRKAVLKKEQAMAYARALVAGFEVDNLHNLISFSDAFGALRLREACMNFLELCNKKNKDKIWMDEVAAIQACSQSELSILGTSGVVLAGESYGLSQAVLTTASASESLTRHGSLDTNEESNVQPAERAAQLPTWPNYPPQYMQPYPGYLFPGMQVASSHYPGTAPWPVNIQDSGMYVDADVKDGKNKTFRSFTNKREKFANHMQPESRRHAEGTSTDQFSSKSDSSDEQEHEASLPSGVRMHDKKHNKSSSRKVVIRNINYIASGRNEAGSSASSNDSYDEDEYVDDGSLKQHVEAAVSSLNKHQKSTSRRNKVRDESKKSCSRPENALDMDTIERTPNSVEEKKDESWDIFQSLLMRDSDSTYTDKGSKIIQVQEESARDKACGEDNFSSSEKKLHRPNYASDGFIFSERSAGNEIGETDTSFEGRENLHGVVKRSGTEELLILQRSEGEYYSQNSHLGTETSIIKTQKEEDWLIGTKPGISPSPDSRIGHAIFNGDQVPDNHFQTGKNQRDVALDDSFMIQSRLSDGPLETQYNADIFMVPVPDLVEANQSKHRMPENLDGKFEASNFCEPDDLFVMLGRDTAADHVSASWNPEMDYGIENSLGKSLNSQCNTESGNNVDAAVLLNGKASNIKANTAPGRGVDGMATKSKTSSGSLGRSKSDILLKSKTSTAGSRIIRSKAEKEEEKRKKLEDLQLQRQKRIAERSAAKGLNARTSTRPSKEGKKNDASTGPKKTKLPESTDENKRLRKPVMRSSTINRLAMARTTNKQLLTEPKVVSNREAISNGSALTTTSSLRKTKGTRKEQDTVNIPSDNITGVINSKSESSTSQGQGRASLDKKIGTNNSKSNSSTFPGKDSSDNMPSISDELGHEVQSCKDDIEDFRTIHIASAVEKRETNTVPLEDSSDDKNCIEVLPDKDLVSLEDPSTHIEKQGNIEDHVHAMLLTTGHPTVGSIPKSDMLKIGENGYEKKKVSISPQISVVDISTPPPNNETNPELIHSRKKWNNGESSPKVPKGFRKLLLFGRKS